MSQPLNSLEENLEAQDYELLAATFDGPDTDRLFELFATLAALCQEKARVIEEINKTMPLQSKTLPQRSGDARPRGKVIPWPTAPVAKSRKRAGGK